MNSRDLKPANQLALKYGVKTLCYGGPGTGKTPLANTAPRPVLCVVEPGMLSMRTSNIPAFAAFDAAKIKEFFDWVFLSNESKNFDTICIDSISQLAEIILTDQLRIQKNPLKAYGEMSRKVMEIVNGLYFMQNKHVYLIAKQTQTEENGIQRKKPYFPGQDLNVKIPHLYDEILHLGLNNLPQFPKPVIAFRTLENIDTMARDRSGKLNEIEEPKLTNIFNKCMS